MLSKKLGRQIKLLNILNVSIYCFFVLLDRESSHIWFGSLNTVAVLFHCECQHGHISYNNNYMCGKRVIEFL